jgi:hypothetical protein
MIGGLKDGGIPGRARFMNIAESSLEESRCYLILAQDLGYGDTSALMIVLEEVSRLLNAYASAIPASGSGLPASHIPPLWAGYQGRSPCLVTIFGKQFFAPAYAGLGRVQCRTCSQR